MISSDSPLLRRADSNKKKERRKTMVPLSSTSFFKKEEKEMKSLAKKMASAKKKEKMMELTQKFLSSIKSFLDDEENCALMDYSIYDPVFKVLTEEGYKVKKHLSSFFVS